MTYSADILKSTFTKFSGFNHYWLAYSGGLDSTVLLHSLSSFIPVKSVTAIHIDHGLLPESKAWVEHCKEFCIKLGVKFLSIEVNIVPEAGDSLEALARERRYAAIKPNIQQDECLLTAHHGDDQIETFLMHLLRGSGTHGLAAMAECSSFGNGQHLRPLLQFSRADLEQYAKLHALHWIEDHSNTDLRFDRNFMRHKVIPIIRERWVSMNKTLLRSAALQADAAGLLNELALIDMHAPKSYQTNVFSIAKLEGLSFARQKNLLRFWIRMQGAEYPSEAVLHEIIKMGDAVQGSNPVVHWHHHEIRRYRDELYLMPELTEHDASLTLQWDLTQDLYIETLNVTLNIKTLPVELQQHLRNSKTVQVKFRQGGERIQLAGRQHSHSLKNIFQEQGIPVWLRDRLPLIYVDDYLLAVIGISPCIIADISHN